jgi:hypothetical protein
MPSSFSTDAAEFRRNVAFLTRQLETIAVRAGVPDGDCADPQSLFAALPLSARDEAVDLLDHIQLKASDADLGVAFAARYLLRLARDVWGDWPAAPTTMPAPARRPTV